MDPKHWSAGSDARTLWQSIHRVVRGRSRDAHEAEDAVQDALLRALEKPPRSDESIPRWLRVVAIRNLIEARRVQASRARREQIAARDEALPSVLDALERESSHEAVARLLGRVNEPYREVVRLRYVEDCEIAAIAERLGRSEGTVRSQLKRGLDQLRPFLGGRQRDGRLPLAGLLALGRRLARRVATRPAVAFPALLASALLVLIPLLASARLGERGLAVASAPDTASSAPERTAAGRVASAVTPADALERTAPQSRTWSVDVTGRACDEDGLPIAGAAIWARDEDSSEGRVVARSGPDGRFLVERADRADWLWAVSNGLLSSNRHLASTVPPRGVDLVLPERRGRLLGRLVAADGRPVSDAEVRLHFPDEYAVTGVQRTLELPPPAQSVRSDARGSFELWKPAQTGHALLVTAADQPPAIRSVSALSSADEELEIPLAEPLALAGRVRARDGAPVAGALVRASFPPPLPARETHTSGDGSFRLANLPGGAYRLQVLDLPADAGSRCTFGTLAPGPEERLELELADGCAVLGSATAEDGTALAGWTVVLAEERPRLPFHRDVRSARTGADGSFAFPSCAEDSAHFLWLFDPAGDGRIPQARLLDVKPSPVTAELVTEPGSRPSAVLRGRFDGPGDLPTMVCLRNRASVPEPVWLPVDPHGRFETPLLPASDYLVHAWTPGLGTWKADLLKLAPDSTKEAVFRPKSTGTLVLQCDSVSLPAGIRAGVQTPGLFTGDATIALVLTLAERRGGFVGDLPPGAHEYWVSAPGFPLLTGNVVVLEGRTTVEPIRLHGGVRVTVRLSCARDLVLGEALRLTSINADGYENSCTLNEASSAKNAPEVVAIEQLLPPGTRTLRVESFGRRSTRTEPFTPLRAELDLTGRWPSEGDALTLELE